MISDQVIADFYTLLDFNWSSLITLIGPICVFSTILLTTKAF